MKISVFGTGYVGLVTGVCFAEMGNDVICADIDAGKIARLKDAISPIYEPGLDDLIASNLKSKRIQFSTDLKSAVQESDLLFIAVGTPSGEDGSADLSYVMQVAETITTHINSHKVVINKSTVPVGTAEKVKSILKKQNRCTFDVVSNPEFLREGAAIEDCLKPARVVVGCESEKAQAVMKRLYEPFLKSGGPILFMDPPSAELTKYAANAMLATKISLMNEFSRVAEKVGADIELVRRGIGSDPRIGPHFIYAGVGYGGSCFPKDVKALIHIGRTVDEKMSILEEVEATNDLQRKHFFEKLLKQVSDLRGKTIALWGVAFKPGTDDIREAPALDIIRWCVEAGAIVQAFDPVAEKHAKEYFRGKENQLHFFEDQYEALQGADALCLMTEWKSFREPNFERMKKQMKNPLILDGRNVYSKDVLKENGFQYFSIGRP